MEVHDKMGEPINMGVAADDNINDENFNLDAVDDDMDREWRPEDFVHDEETEDDEPWDREDEMFADVLSE